MRFQFGTRSVFLATAFAAVCLTAWGLVLKRFSDPRVGAHFYSVPAFTALVLLAVSPLWIPLLFAAYAVGRKTLGVGLTIAFAVVEAISIVAMYLAVAALSN